MLRVRKAKVMSRIRILVIDDSVVIRKILTQTLSADPELEVVGAASDGRIGLAKIVQSPPDIVTLDVEMPVMDGLTTLAEIRKLYPKLPVIMFSTLTERGAEATLDALSRGASDYATKPSNTGSQGVAIESIRTELIPKIKALVRRPNATAENVQANGKAARSATHVPPARKIRRRPIEIVAIGTSTGGPNALAEVIPTLPSNFPVPIAVVQHMPPVFTRQLADRLASRAQLHVEEGRQGAALVPGHVWIAPGNFHMTVKHVGFDWQIALNQDAPENSCRPAVDVLFRSVASVYGGSALGVVMTGMGADGVIGAQKIREAGGDVIIQDEASSVVWGMPGLVYAAGQADAVYPLEQLGREITRRVLESRTFRVAQSSANYASVEGPGK